MAKRASHLICPYLFHHGPSSGGKFRGKKQKLGRDAITFGEVFEDYIYRKIAQDNGVPATKNLPVSMYGISGVYDIATHEAVIEVKYSTRVPVKDLIETAKPQAAFYALALGLPKAIIIAGNPLETGNGKIADESEDAPGNIEIYEMDSEELKKWQGYILKVVRGYDEPRVGTYCDLCPLRKKCPAFKNDKSN